MPGNREKLTGLGLAWNRASRAERYSVLMSGVVPCHLQAVSCTCQPIAGYMAAARASRACPPAHRREGASMCMQVRAGGSPHAEHVRLIHDVHHDAILGDGV